MKQELIREYNGVKIRQRADDYLLGTAMCQAHGKLIGHYLANQETQEFLAELSTSIGIPIDVLVQVIRKGPNECRGTWVHKLVGYNLAQWLSAKFAVHVAIWLDMLNATGRVEIPGAQPSVLDATVAMVSKLGDVLANVLDRLARLEQPPLVAPRARETGNYFGLREHLREVWPNATEADKKRMVAHLVRLAGRRKWTWWEPVTNGPIVVDQCHIAEVNEAILREMKKKLARTKAPVAGPTLLDLMEASG